MRINVLAAFACLLVSGLFGAVPMTAPRAEAQEQLPNDNQQEIEIEEAPFGEVQEGDGQARTTMLPYRERRSTFGTTFSVNYVTYEPVNYQPDFLPDKTFEEEYGSAEFPMINGVFSLKYNGGFGSIGAEVGGGYYQNLGENNTQLSLNQVFGGAIITLDTISPEPYFAPYASIGMTFIEFTEERNSDGRGGTELYFYYTAGALIQLDWIDKDGDYNSYQNGGVENTFLNVGIHSIIGTPAPDADFTNDIALNAGVRIEL